MWFRVHVLTIIAAVAALLQQINAGRIHIISITDIHGHFLGHPKEAAKTADIALLASFIERLKRKRENVFAFENGDFCDGGGLFDYSNRFLRRGELILPIVAQVGFDARSFGNHELYHEDVLRSVFKYYYNGSSPNNVLVTSNIVDAKVKNPRFNTNTKRFIRFPLSSTKSSSQQQLLVFAFLYEMTDSVPSVRVEKVAKIVQEEWFRNEISNENTSAIVFLCHMHFENPLLRVMLKAVRAIRGDLLPVVFLTGHTHIKGATKLDNNSFSFEASKFFDTIGVLSFDVSQASPTNFAWQYVDANEGAMLRFLNSSAPLLTEKGASIRQQVNTVASVLRLNEKVGYVSRDYVINAPTLQHERSLWNFYLTTVIATVFHDDGNAAFVSGNGRDLYQMILGVSGKDLNSALHRLGRMDSLALARHGVGRSFLPLGSMLPNFVHFPYDVSDSLTYNVIVDPYDLKLVKALLPQYPAVQLRESPFSTWIKYFKRRPYS